VEDRSELELKDLPLPSTEIKPKRSTPKLERWTRAPQKVRKQQAAIAMQAVVVEPAVGDVGVMVDRVVVTEKIHGETIEPETTNKPDGVDTIEREELDEDACPNIVDSDDEEDCKDCPLHLLSKNQQNRRKLRLEREKLGQDLASHQLNQRRIQLERRKAEQIKVHSEEIARLDEQRRAAVKARNAVLWTPTAGQLGCVASAALGCATSSSRSPVMNRFRSGVTKGLTEGGSQSLTKPADGRTSQHAMRAPVKAKPVSEQESKALMNYQAFMVANCRVPPGGCTIEHVRKSSAGVKEWARESNSPDTLLRIGKSELASKSMCALWAKQALSAVSAVPRWERVVLTVDSGASDTVLPPDIASNVPLLHSAKVGTEYEVANGGVVINLGERKAEMKLKESDASSMLMSFQVVEVHKPLLAVSRLVENGHRVSFDKHDPHILLGNGTKVPMRCNLGTYEVEVYILNPGFTGPR
jgi:hypothetical protein